MSDKVHIFDTTLRDAEQSPGAALNQQEKMQIARHLAQLQVDVIEAGFPISSPADFEAVQRIAEEIEGPEICALSRVVEKDITAAWQAIQSSKRPRIHTFVGTSDIHIEGIMRRTREEVLKMAVEMVTYARSLCEVVEFSPMDATRTDLGYLCDVVEATIEAGATIINIPDTVGYAMPDQFGTLIRDLRERVPNIDQCRLSVHCHDDLGLSVANAVAAVQNGVRQVECTMNGLGERAGNTSLEEIVMAIRTRRDYFADLYTEISAREIYPISRLVSRLMGMSVAPNKAIVGANAFAHSSGIHQDGVIKQRNTFEIMQPEDVGIQESKLILSPRSGRNALRHRLSVLGYTVEGERLDRIYEKFLVLADKKKQVLDADLEVLMRGEVEQVAQTYRLESIQVLSGSKLTPMAMVSIRKGEEVIQEASSGDGPVDAVYRAIDRVTDLPLSLSEYTINAVTQGKDAIGEVIVKVQDNGRTIIGHGASTDVIEASAQAYMHAVNKLVASRG